MALDPILEGLLAQLPAVPPGPLDFPKMREQAKAMLPLLIGPAGVAEVSEVEERSIAGAAGQIPVCIYRPVGASRGTLHYIHGGGWSAGDLSLTDPLARRLCRDLEMVVVTSSYRLAPEHPFPAAYEDALAAAAWVRDYVEDLGGRALPLVIAGDSAGGNLAAAACIGLREADDVALGLSSTTVSPRQFDLQLLLYPAVDLRPSAWEFPSRKADADPTLRAASLEQIYPAYAGNSDSGDWRLSPLAADDLATLPRAIIVVLGVDPLRDEALQYAQRLMAAAVVAEVIELDNLTHGFAHMASIVPAADEALQVILESARITLRRAKLD